MKSAKKRQNSNENIRLQMGKQILMGSIIGTILFFLMILTFSFLIIKSDISDSLQNIISFLSAIASAFIGGYASAFRLKSKGLIRGIISAFVQAIIVAVILLSVLQDLGLRTILMIIAMMLGGAIGGITAVNKRKKR